MTYFLFLIAISTLVTIPDSTYAQTKLQYLCETVQFGERLPIRIVQADSKKQIVFNPHMQSTNSKTKQKTTRLHKIKKTVFVDPLKNKSILETRYVTYPQPPFKINLFCDDKKDCSGAFENEKKSMTLSIDQNVIEDSRPEVKSITAELSFGPREKARLIVRISKKNITSNSGLNITTSSSGETVFSADRSTVEIDVGTDEHLKIYETANGPVSERLAAAEIKLVCRKL